MGKVYRKVGFPERERNWLEETIIFRLVLSQKRSMKIYIFF
jgi:hypothetical protein